MLSKTFSDETLKLTVKDLQRYYNSIVSYIQKLN